MGDNTGPTGAGIEGRVYGQFPISISTSMAIEGLLGVHPDMPPPPKPPYQNYAAIWFNVRTIFRNLHGAIAADVRANLKATDYAQALYNELMVIQRVLAQETHQTLTVQFYLNKYDTLQLSYPHATLKQPVTAGQHQYKLLEQAVYTYMANMATTGLDIVLGHLAITMQPVPTLMVTHLPVDLLHAKGASSLELLESHTGVIKAKWQWHTKLVSGSTLTRIPFDRMTMQMFGDTGGMFKPGPAAHKAALLKIAETYNWTPATTQERILLCVESAKEPILLSDIRQLYSSVL